jgi:hypothetical protein
MTQSASAATLPVIRALLDEANRKDYRSGVLGVRARPVWSAAAEFTHGSTLVRVVPCESALAVWEAITGRDKNQWLVVLTDREDDDLGAGIRAHLIGNRLRTPDPWEAVRQRFAATGLDPALTSSTAHREIATGLLAAAPRDGWPPAPAGVLTRDHAFGSVAFAHLAFADPVVDLTSVLGWTAEPGLPARIADLRDLAGHPLTDAVLHWAASRCGAVGGPILHLLRAGEARDCVPLGLVAGLLARVGDSPDGNRSRIGREGLIRLEPRLGPAAPGPAALVAWDAESAAVLLDLLSDQRLRSHGEVLLVRAGELLAAVHGEGAADDSELLQAGLTRRLATLADALRQSLASRAVAPDEPWVRPADLGAVEEAWGRISAHRLAGPGDHRVAAFHAGVRLARYLSFDSALPSSLAASAAQDLAGLAGRHMGQDAWADSAFNDAAAGVSDPDLGSGLGVVLSAVTVRRSAHDTAFAAALARYTAGEGDMPRPEATGIVRVEDLLSAAVFPLARQAPALLLVLDGMSAANAAEIVASVLARAGEGWAEALLPGADRRGAALAALPTLTEVSRAALLTGRLGDGGQDAEQRGYARLCRENGIATPPIFHKKPLDSSLPGHSLPADVTSAIADVTRWPLVTCVLNTIDDALDRADPGGTEWTAAAVRHLLPLLERARYAGRVVVLTADHGHVVERRQGTQRSYPDTSSGRSRAATEPAAEGEILVNGERVTLHGGRAVLAVDERVRFGPLKAGYHGGATPAEAVVPVAVLLAGGVPEGTGLRLAPPQEPGWWADPVIAGTSSATRAPAPGRAADRPARRRPVPDPRLRSSPGAVPTLFDLPAEDDEPTATPEAAPGPGDRGRIVAEAVVSSRIYESQRRIAGRVSISDDRVRDLLAALLAAPDARLSPAQAAIALAVAPVALRGAIVHAQRLLNVEGYPILRVDADGATVILDEPLLREQFGLGS